MKLSYTPPFCKDPVSFSDLPVLALSANSWEDSIQDVGTSWGGVDTDDSVYGL